MLGSRWKATAPVAAALHGRPPYVQRRRRPRGDGRGQWAGDSGVAGQQKRWLTTAVVAVPVTRNFSLVRRHGAGSGDSANKAGERTHRENRTAPCECQDGVSSEIVRKSTTLVRKQKRPQSGKRNGTAHRRPRTNKKNITVTYDMKAVVQAWGGASQRCCPGTRRAGNRPGSGLPPPANRPGPAAVDQLGGGEYRCSSPRR